MNKYYKCRLCLEETSRNIDIFNEDDFPNMIELLTGLKVDPMDGLPTTSCIQCQKEVKSAMLTRYQIINSYKILKNELRAFNDDKKPSPNQISSGVQEVIDVTVNGKQHTADNNLFDEIYIEIESEKTSSEDKNINDNAIKLVTDKSKEIIFPKNMKNSDSLSEDLKLEIVDDSSSDCFQSRDSGSETSNHPVISTCKSKILSRKVKRSSEITVRSSNNEKQIPNKLIKHNLRQRVANKDIKFKRKRRPNPTLAPKNIQFKKKISGDPLYVKVDYDIKPEHRELLKTVGKKERVACPICQREMFGMNLKNHLITHNFDPVICDTCGKTSKNAQALQDHINYYHKTTPDRFMCDKCGKGYRVRFMLERHEKKEHGDGEKDYECTVCGKRFFEKLQLKNHINITHNKIKPFKCEHCGKDFGRRTQFVTHQLVHTKENRYHCQVCGKGFKIKQTMQTHLKGVHGIEEEKTIFCKICQKGFSSAQGLRAHVNSRVHGLEKCEHCTEYITFEYKNVHLKEIHGIEIKIS